MTKADSIAYFSYKKRVEELLPEQRQVVMNGCVSCGQKCENLCLTGESVALGLSIIRFNQMSLWN